MTAGIYRFINNRTGEVYVGQSTNVWVRRANHHKELASGKHHNKGLQEDHDRGDTFTFEVLEKMPEATRKELEEREIYYIEKFNSFYEGYNQTPGGEYDKLKGKYEYGGGRLPFIKYTPVKPLTCCPCCGGELVKQNGKYGEFAGCINYPKCSFSCSLKKTASYSLKSICNSCGNMTPEGYYFACPFCGNPLDEDSTLDKNSLLEMLKDQTGSTTSDSGMSFKQFCSKKRNYLNRYDCEFLSKEYHIDISNIDTVKKSNLVIKNYLTEKDLWNCAMEDLFINNIRLSDVKYKQKIGDTILGNCPNCGDKLKRDSEFFIVCASYPDCDFSCIDDYYYDHILTLNSERESISSESNSKIKNENIADKDINSNPIIISNYNKDKINNQEKLQNDAKLNKSIIHNNVGIVNSTGNKNLNYCSNCGSFIELKDEYCANCGEKISRTSINQQKLKSTQKRNWEEIIGVILVVTIIALFIFSIIIMNFDIDGPISTIAAAIFISVVCFFCYVNIEGK